MLGAIHLLDDKDDKIFLDALIKKYAPINEFDIPQDHLLKYSIVDKGKQAGSVNRCTDKAEEYVLSVYGIDVLDDIEMWKDEKDGIADNLKAMRCYVSENSIDNDSKRCLFEIFDLYATNVFIDAILKLSKA